MVYSMWLFGFVIVIVFRGVVPDWTFPEYCAPKNSVKLDATLSILTNIPPLPVLPKSFQVQVEAQLIDRKLTKNGNIFYDEEKRRAAVQIFGNNQTVRSIFDFALNQTIFVSNGTCYVRDYLTTDQSILIGAKQNGNSTSGTLNFDIANGLLYKGRKTVRGIDCDWWQSCVSWVQTNFTLDYFFSVNDQASPFSSSQVPVLAEIKGSKYMIPNDIPIHHTYEYFDFRSGIWNDGSVFEIPSGMVCPGLPIIREMPTIPEQFSFREEVLDMNGYYGKDIPNSFVYYDHKAKIAIYTEKDPLIYQHLMYTLQDFNSGVSYTVDTETNNCTMSSISNTTFSATSLKLNHLNIVRMKSAQKLFFLDNTTYTYTGKRTIRGILCDSFISRKTDFHLPGLSRFNSTFEVYFKNDDGYESTRTGVPVQLRITTPTFVGFYVKYNVYDFTEGPRSTEIISISSCYNSKSKTSFMISFPGPSDSSFISNQKLLISKITDLISSLLLVPVLRVQDRRIIITNDSFHFIATLLDKPPPIGSTQFKEISSSLASAMIELKNIVIIGSFSLTLNISGQLRTVTADSIQDNIFRSDPRPLSTKYVMDKFTVQRNKAAVGFNVLIITHISVDDCATECLNAKSFVCNAFSFSFDIGYCSLYKIHPDKRPKIIKNIKDSFLFIKKYTVDYEKIAGITLLPISDINYQNINSVETCAKLCSNYEGFTCKSFDFCDTLSTCSLGRSRFYDIPKDDIEPLTNCSHYSRKYLADFKKVSNQPITSVDQGLLISGVSIGQCAKLCVEDGIECASFIYCGQTIECRLSTMTMWNISENGSISTPNCEVYRLHLSSSTQIIPSSTTKSTSVSGETKSASVSAATESSAKVSVSSDASKTIAAASVITPTNVMSSGTKSIIDGQKHSKQSSSEKDVLPESKSPSSINKGLSAGAVVGVAFGMMISGILLASLTYAGIILLKRRKPDEMRSKLTEHELS